MKLQPWPLYAAGWKASLPDQIMWEKQAPPLLGAGGQGQESGKYNLFNEFTFL